MLPTMLPGPAYLPALQPHTAISTVETSSQLNALSLLQESAIAHLMSGAQCKLGPLKA